MDVLVVGAHASAHLASAVLAHEHPGIRLLHVAPAGDEPIDRLLIVNALLRDLHPLIRAHKLFAELPTASGLQFLSESPGVRGEHESDRQPAMVIASMREASKVLRRLAETLGVKCVAPREFAVERVVDDGVMARIDGASVVARVMVVSTAALAAEQKRLLGIAGEWEGDVVHRCGFLRLRPTKGVVEIPPKRTVPMSLDLEKTGAWAWMLFDGGGDVQFSVQQPMATVRSHPPERLMGQWIDLLAKHGIVRSPQDLLAQTRQAKWADLPVGGALSAETVANRTLLIGPAGGFYSACGEELYPACWSAVAAAAVAGKALRATHVQDALQAYRQQWGSTLGDYLRGPQQNLTLLLPLVYRNAVMAARVGEAILFGESMVR